MYNPNFFPNIKDLHVLEFASVTSPHRVPCVWSSYSLADSWSSKLNQESPEDSPRTWTLSQMFWLWWTSPETWLPQKERILRKVNHSFFFFFFMCKNILLPLNSFRCLSKTGEHKHWQCPALPECCQVCSGNGLGDAAYGHTRYTPSSGL